MNKNTIVDPEIVNQKIEENELLYLGSASIREITRLVNQLERETGVSFIRMEMGVPGLKTPDIGVRAEIEALERGVSSIYPYIEGIRPLKEETSRFLKLFLDIEIQSRNCLPTVGSLMGGMLGFLVANRNDHTKEGTLFLDPGFPVHKQQVRMLGHSYQAFDVYNYRGKKLKDKMESYLSGGKISSILYSNPNNPAWICFTEEELEIIGDLANKHDVIVIEDLAYFGMDFRKDYSKPGQPPYQPTVAHYTRDYMLLISCSKIFSYAGQRVGMMAISEHLFEKRYPDLLRYYRSDRFGDALIYSALYGLSAGVSHSAQYGLAALFKAVNDGEYDYISAVKEYGDKAAIMKKMFIDNGFYIVYDTDLEDPVADGFYFTVGYPGLTGGELITKMLYYGISAISLEITGSDRSEGLRACVSQVPRKQFEELEKRLKLFRIDHPVTKK